MPTWGLPTDMTTAKGGEGGDMPEASETPTQSAQSAETERTFTQSEMDAIIGDRLKRERAKYADYEELKGKAAKYDEAEQAAKSDLEKAVEERDALKAQLDEMKAEKARAEAVAEAAAKHGVSAELLSRMSGDVDENARFLKAQAEGQPRYGQVPDAGETVPPSASKTSGDVFAEVVESMFKNK